MMHVTIITPVFAVDEKDSISLPFLQLFCKELVKQGIELTIISEQFPKHKDYLWNGIRVHTLKRKTPKLLYKFLRTYLLNKTLKKIHRSKPIHVIHNLWFNILGQISEEFALKNKIKHLTTLAGQDILADNTYLSLIQAYSGKLISPSEYHKNKLLERYNLNISIIGWGIEDVKLTRSERTIDLIHCGWINAVKNNSQFLEIVNVLKKKGLVKRAVICGGGPLFNELVENIKRLDLTDVIEIKNSISRTEVLDLMQQSKILVHTSHFESFGLVLAEGLACNCIVLSTPVGIAAENKNIICCTSTEQFVSEIETVLNTYSISPANKNHYPISKTAKEYIKAYAVS